MAPHNSPLAAYHGHVSNFSPRQLGTVDAPREFIHSSDGSLTQVSSKPDNTRIPSPLNGWQEAAAKTGVLLLPDDGREEYNYVGSKWC